MPIYFPIRKRLRKKLVNMTDKLQMVNDMNIFDDVKTRFGVAVIGAVTVLAAMLGLMTFI